MIKLKPTEEAQSFSIIPSGYDLSSATLKLTENGTNIIQGDVSYSWQISSNGNFIEITLIEALQAVNCNFANLTNLSGDVVQVPYIDCINDEQNLTILEPYQTIQNQVIKQLGDISGLPITVEWVVGGPANKTTAQLKEDSIYTLEIFTSADILYRDTVYITNNENKKEVFSYPQAYTQHDDGEDEYIVL